MSEGGSEKPPELLTPPITGKGRRSIILDHRSLFCERVGKWAEPAVEVLASEKTTSRYRFLRHHHQCPCPPSLFILPLVLAQSQLGK